MTIDQLVKPESAGVVIYACKKLEIDGKTQPKWASISDWKYYKLLAQGRIRTRTDIQEQEITAASDYILALTGAGNNRYSPHRFAQAVEKVEPPLLVNDELKDQIYQTAIAMARQARGCTYIEVRGYEPNLKKWEEDHQIEMIHNKNSELIPPTKMQSLPIITRENPKEKSLTKKPIS